MLYIQRGITICFDYTNWEGKIKPNRYAKILRLYYGKNDWHPENQWFLECWDIEKQAIRIFAMKDMNNIDIMSE